MIILISKILNINLNINFILKGILNFEYFKMINKHIYFQKKKMNLNYEYIFIFIHYFNSKNH